MKWKRTDEKGRRVHRRPRVRKMDTPPGLPADVKARLDREREVRQAKADERALQGWQVRSGVVVVGDHVSRRGFRVTVTAVASPQLRVLVPAGYDIRRDPRHRPLRRHRPRRVVWVPA